MDLPTPPPPPPVDAPSAPTPSPLEPHNGPAIVGGWTLPAPPPEKKVPALALPPPPPVVPCAKVAPNRIVVGPGESIAAALAAAAKRGGKCLVTVAGGGAPNEAVEVPAGVSLCGGSEEAKPVLRRVVLAGHNAEVELFAITEGVACARGAKNCAVRRCEVSNVGDSAVESEAASLRVEHCVIGDCEDGIKVTRGCLFVSDSTIENCDCDGIFSTPKIQLLKRVTFGETIGRHRINCKAGVVTTIGDEASAAPTPPPAAAAPPMGWQGDEWVATPRSPDNVAPEPDDGRICVGAAVTKKWVGCGIWDGRIVTVDAGSCEILWTGGSVTSHAFSEVSQLLDKKGEPTSVQDL